MKALKPAESKENQNRKRGSKPGKHVGATHAEVPRSSPRQ